MSNRPPSSERDTRGRLLPGHKKLGGRKRWQMPSNLSLADAKTVREQYDRLVRLFDTRKITAADVKAGAELIKLRTSIVLAEDHEARLQALEAQGAQRSDPESD